MEENYSLYQRLKNLDESDEYPFHMPGHKRNKKAAIPGGMEAYDITEIEGFDNLHHAQGILQEAMQRAAKLYHSEQTYFLVNGSSCGILTAISSVINEGETLILGRNAHASAYHGAYLRGAQVKSLFPKMFTACDLYGIVNPQEVVRVLEETPKAKAVMITSPTYDGFVSDVSKIAEIVHFYGKILIVDEAHGAHFGLDKRLPSSSIACGADLVIQSLHKTMPALTQTALLHVNGTLVDRTRVERFLKIYQTSSPSYILMASADHCIRQIQAHGELWYDEFFKNRDSFMQEVKRLRYLRVLDQESCINHGMKALDPGKIVILTDQSGYTGAQLQEILLKQYHLQMEMAGPNYVVAIVTIMDEAQGYKRLAKALMDVDAMCERRYQLSETFDFPTRKMEFALLERAIDKRKQKTAQYTMKEVMDAKEAELEAVSLMDSVGRIVAESVYIYPPGIPIILPGEEMTDADVALIHAYQESNLSVQGLSDRTGDRIKCYR